MKICCLITAAASFILLGPATPVRAQQAPTTTVRGQLLSNGWNQFGAPQVYPASNIQVTLFNPAVGRSWPAVTGQDGMYYFYNIPLGTYNLEIWISNPPRSYPFMIGGLPYHDLPRISIN